jgi:signal transduction histidine kinase
MVDAIRRDFVGNASHELKTPVASIRALAETIAGASAMDPASIPGFARQLEGEAVRLSKVVSDLLDLSRLEGGPSDYGQIRLDQLAREEAERLKTSSREAGLTLVITADAPVTVTGSARDLGLLIRNLVENAIQYTRPGGQIDVSVLGDGREAALIVADTGIGIPSRERDRVFERFYRVDRARSRDTGGTGLGLSIVKHVAENHGGTVTVNSQLGKGSTFTIKLPASGPGAEP